MSHNRLSIFVAIFAICLTSCNRIVHVNDCIDNKCIYQTRSVFALSISLEDSLVEHKFLIKNDIDSYKRLIKSNLEKPRIVDSVFYMKNIDVIEFLSSPATQSTIYSCFSSYYSSSSNKEKKLEYECFRVLSLLHESYITNFEDLNFFFNAVSNEDMDDQLLRLVLISLVFIGGA